MKNKSFVIMLSLFVFITALLLCIISARWQSSANLIDRVLSQNVRNIIGFTAGIIPFSFIEALIILSPVILTSLIIYILKSKNEKREIVRRFLTALSPFFVLLSIFIISGVIPSFCTEYSARIVNTNKEPKSESLILVTKKLISEISAENSEEPTHEDIRKTIRQEIEINSHGYGLNAEFLPKPKRFERYSLLSKLGILGLYSHISCEVVENIEIPKYLYPFTLMHEYMHHLGARSEADANFMAFVLLYNSKNEYLKYSAVLYASEYMLADVYRFSPDMYTKLYRLLPSRAVNDLNCYKNYAAEYKGEAEQIASRINGVYLDSFDSHGSISYSRFCGYITNYLSSA